jgi:ABC-type transport system involved in multi-copper enzyme maturation permease subunit
MTAAESAAARAIIGAPRAVRRAGTWLKAQATNPVLVRDARSLFRGGRAFGLQLGYLVVLLAAIGLAALMCRYERVAYAGRGADLLPMYGRWMFVGLHMTQTVLLLIVVVSYSAAAISLEREKQTYESLAVTSLTSAEVVVGKLSGIVLLCYLLMLTSLPLGAFSLIFGGVSPGEVALWYGLLALKIPLWAALGLLVSVVAGRSIVAYIATLVVVAAENGLSAQIMFAGSDAYAPGIFTPFLAPFADEIECHVVGLAVPPWVLPALLAAVLIPLAACAAAEAMEHYRPTRSAALRLLVLGAGWCVMFVVSVAGMDAWAQGQTSSVPLAVLLGLAWLGGCAAIPVANSYPPDEATRLEDVRFDWDAVGPRRWLARDARGGAGFSLLFWAACVSGVLAAVGLALLSSGPGPVRGLPGFPSLVIGLGIYALSVVAYSTVCVVLAVIHRARREVAFGTVLIMLTFNVTALIYAFGYGVMRKVPETPALVLACPGAAASVFLDTGAYRLLWSRYGAGESIIFAVCYSLLLVGLASWYHRRQSEAAARRRMARESPRRGTLDGEEVSRDDV